MRGVHVCTRFGGDNRPLPPGGRRPKSAKTAKSAKSAKGEAGS
jgi:hypothetical protein